MNYATATDLITRFGANEIAQRADRGEARLVTAPLMTAAAAGASLAGYTGPEQTAAAAALLVVQRALDDARDTINAHVSSRYTLPLNPVPAVLNRVACNLARLYLYDDLATDAVKEQASDDMTLLRGVAKGTASLGADGTTGVQPTSSAAAELVTEGRVWARKDSRDFI